MPDTPITPIKQRIDADLRPAYYDAFHCLAQDCHISCCKGWNITFDRKDYLTLRRQHGSEELNQRMSKSLTRLTNEAITKATSHYAKFHMDGDTCPLLAEDGLCALQKECGHEVLPAVCRTYPRREVASFSGYLERSLSPSCEAVVQLLWDLPQGIDFLSDPLPLAKQSTILVPPPENTSVPSAYFQEIRSLCIDLLQDRRFTLAQRILLMGIYLQKLTEEDLDIPQWLETTAAALAHPDAAKIAARLTQENEKSLRFALFNHLKVMTQFPVSKEDTFSAKLRKDILDALVLAYQVKKEEEKLQVDTDLQKFLDTRKRFLADFGEDEYFLENLAVSVFFHTHLPNVVSKENIWKSYVGFCNTYSFFRFMAICGYLDADADEEGRKEAIFRGIVFASRFLLHSTDRQAKLRDEFFDSNNSSLAHMQTLLSL